MNHRVMVGVLVEGRAVARMAQNTSLTVPILTTSALCG
jgi:hypothetical protein